MSPHFIRPEWPAPTNIVAFTTTRENGYSRAPYESFNLAAHVGDDIAAVNKNRTLLCETAELPQQPAWLQQTHSTLAVAIDSHYQTTEADACYTQLANTPCAVMTADCLPLLVCNQAGTEVAAIHAGWRGLANGIIENTLHKLTSNRQELLVWLGPAIGPKVYEVSREVYDTFTAHDPKAALAFHPLDADHWLADMYQLARQRLSAAGVTKIYGGEYCTYSDPQRFYSFRRDKTTGRMASVIFFR